MFQQQGGLSGREYNSTKTILIVEDDAGVGAFLVQALVQETPYRPVLAADGLQALKIVHSLKPSLFILDYQLPFLNGIELYDRLHAMKELERTPAIIMSANLPIPEVKKRHLRNLRKPFDLDDLLTTVEKTLV
jgi:DNA-binding NtrC family response regulator